MLCLLLPNPPSDLKPPVQARELSGTNGITIVGRTSGAGADHTFRPMITN